MFRRIASVVLFSGFTWAAPVSAGSLASLLPEETEVFLEISNVTKFREVPKHPIIDRFLESESGAPFRKLIDAAIGEAPAEMRKLETVVREETGLSIRELLSRFTGSFAAGVSMPFGELIVDEGFEKISGLVVADFSGDLDLAEGILDLIAELTPDREDDDDRKPWAKWGEDYEESEVEVEGVTIRKWTLRDPDRHQGPPQAVAVAGGKLFIGAGPVEIEDAVRRQLRDSDDGSLAATPGYRNITEEAGEWDILGGLVLESILNDIREGTRRQLEHGNTGGLPLNPLQVWDGLGLKQIRTGIIALDLQEDALECRAVVTYDGKPAALSWYVTNGPGDPPLFAPADADDVSWGTLDFGRMFDELRNIAVAFGPVVGGGLEMAVNTVKTKSGVDLREDIFGQMGDNYWSVNRGAFDEEAIAGDDDEDIPAVDASAVMGVALRDARAFDLSLTSLFNSLAPGKALFDDREYLGSTIHRIRELPPSMEVAWMIHNDMLILSVGKPDLLEQILGGMAKRPAEPLVTQDYVIEAFSKLPDGHVTSGVSSLSSFANLLIEFVRMAAGEVDEGLPGALKEAIDALPDKVDFPGVSVSRGYVNDRLIGFRVRFVPKL